MNDLSKTQDRLIDHLEKRGYSRKYILSVLREIRMITHMRKIGTWVSYEERLEYYRNGGYSRDYVQKRIRLVDLLSRFEKQGILPVPYLDKGKSSRPSFPIGSTRFLSREFQDVILNYVMTEEERGLRVSSITVGAYQVSSFLRFMQDKGLTRLREIRESHVWDFFFKDGLQRRGCTCKHHIRQALKAYGGKCRESLDVALCLPDIKRTKKNIQYLTPGEVLKIKQALGDCSNALNYRDRAVGALLVHTGLRSCDIASLRLEDIRWKEDVITLNQQKTGVGLTLPLRPVVGNPIFDYLEKERPRVGSGNLFLAKRAPHKGISPKTVSSCIALRIFRAAGVRQAKGDRRGSHIFRHNLAISLLENDVPQPVISATLGHVSPRTTENYLSADFSHLKECAIDISKYPISEEVFDV